MNTVNATIISNFHFTCFRCGICWSVISLIPTSYCSIYGYRSHFLDQCRLLPPKTLRFPLNDKARSPAAFGVLKLNPPPPTTQLSRHSWVAPGKGAAVSYGHNSKRSTDTRGASSNIHHTCTLVYGGYTSTCRKWGRSPPETEARRRDKEICSRRWVP